MPSHTQTHLLAVAPSGATMNVWTATPAEAEALAEALHEARPGWRLRIADRRPVFSREGKLVHLIERHAA